MPTLYLFCIHHIDKEIWANFPDATIIHGLQLSVVILIFRHYFDLRRQAQIRQRAHVIPLYMIFFCASGFVFLPFRTFDALYLSKDDFSTASVKKSRTKRSCVSSIHDNFLWSGFCFFAFFRNYDSLISMRCRATDFLTYFIVGFWQTRGIRTQ